MIRVTGTGRILQEIVEKTTGSCRKALEIDGIGSSIPAGIFLDFFPVDFRRILSSFSEELVGNHGKKVRWEYCFHVPGISDAFLQDPVVQLQPGNHICYQTLHIFFLSIYAQHSFTSSRLLLSASRRFCSFSNFVNVE